MAHFYTEACGEVEKKIERAAVLQLMKEVRVELSVLSN